MSEIGTLKELNVRPGDVVTDSSPKEYERTFTVLSGCKLKLVYENGYSQTLDRGWFWDECIFHLISRAADTPKLWRDMTPEEKGALLLAFHDGKTVQIYNDGIWEDKRWAKCYCNWAYRVKPDPKIETVEMSGADVRFSSFFKGHKITFNTIDGKHDCSSIKMEEL